MWATSLPFSHTGPFAPSMSLALLAHKKSTLLLLDFLIPHLLLLSCFSALSLDEKSFM